MQTPPRLSLIVATLGREAELLRCLYSLAGQTSRDFEVIVVDQNADDRVTALLDRAGASFLLTHVRAPPGLSRARNVGLRLARGGIVGFPDDDCWYDVDIVARVLQFFAGEPSAQGLSGGGAASAGGAPRARFARSHGWVTAERVWTQGMSSAIFLRRELIAAVGPFDEALGVGSGTPWPAAEETDYLLRAVARGGRIWYDPTFEVHHPGNPVQPEQKILDRGRRYARAMGYVLAKHRRSRVEIAYHVVRAVTGAVLSLLRARWSEARLYAAVAGGRVRGWRDGVAARENTSVGAANEGEPSEMKQPV
ncbi:MAG TPA: glycosyltransferase family A protein [Casimicrobiaceae bacterium]|nr:glycosyltransferase family A protein [Casimicrobiaceae bacterium]